MSNEDSPRLQLAVDATDLPTALRLVEAVYPYYDIAEVGTPLIIEEGLHALEALQRAFPDKQYLADLKIMDAGRLEAESAFRRGPTSSPCLPWPMTRRSAERWKPPMSRDGKSWPT